MEEPAPQVFEYLPEAPRVGGTGAPSCLMMLLPGAAVIGVGGFLGTNWGLAAAVLTILVMAYRSRRKREPAHARLQTDSGRLVVTNARAELIVNLNLDDLDDVALDTRTVQRVQEAPGTSVYDLLLFNNRLGPPVDCSRIELVTAEERVPLTEHYTSSSDATDWFVKIRLFLRKNGWQPKAER